MRKNVGRWERLLRLIFGTLMTAWAIAGGPYWAYGGLILMITGAWGFCPVHWLWRKDQD